MKSPVSGADSGDARALYKLGVRYYNGDGVIKDVRRAFAIMQKAAKAGSVQAHAALGSHYDYGIGVRRSPGRAFQHYLLAAHAGDVGSHYSVAACYYVGLGTPRDYRAAVRWLKQPVDARIPEATYLLACCYENGQGVRGDRDRAAALFRVAARRGHPDAHVEVGLRYHETKPGRAVAWYREAARLHSAYGQYNLALCLERGHGVRQNLREALRWYRAAARLGHQPALAALRRLRR